MAGLDYRIYDANENAAECQRLGILQAPTLVVNSRDLYPNLSNIIKYVELNALSFA